MARWIRGVAVGMAAISFFASAEARAQEGRDLVPASATLTVERLPAGNDVTATYPVDVKLAGMRGAPAPGALIALFLRVETERGFHIYGPEEVSYEPTTLRLAEGAPATLDSIRWPELHPGKDAPYFPSGSLIAVRLRLAADLPAEPVVTIDFGFSACDEMSCLPPQKWRLHVRLQR